jgi:hypothetical protein
MKTGRCRVPVKHIGQFEHISDYFDRRERPAKEERLWINHVLYRERVLFMTIQAVVVT